MTSGVPWQVKGVRAEAIETAREAARRSGMPVEDWLDSIIAQSARHAGVDSPRVGDRYSESERTHEPESWRRRHSDRDDRPRADTSDVNSRLDALSRQLDELRHPGGLRPQANPSPIDDTRLINETRPDRTVDRAPQADTGRRGYAVESGMARPHPGAGASSEVDQALAEIEARQRSLDGEAAAPRMEFARAPTQRLPDLEQQLRQINARMESMRPCGFDHAVDTLRDDLAEIGVMLKEAMPRQAIESLESEVRSLSSSIDSKRNASVDHAVDTLREDLATIAGMLKDAMPRQAIESLESEVRSLTSRIDSKRNVGIDQAVDTLRDDLATIGAMLKDAMPRQAIESLESEVRSLTSRIDSKKNDGIDQAVDTLRDDLATIGAMLKDAMPRQAIEALESEVRSLTSRIDSKRHAGIEHGAIAGIEHGLSEVRDALHALTPAENLVGFDQAVQSLSLKIDQLAGTGQDSATVKQLEGSIVALRGVVSQIASDEALAKLSEEVRTLSAKVDQVSAPDAFSSIEQRIAAIADAVQASAVTSLDTRELETVLAALADKIERMHATRVDETAIGQLQTQIARVADKLDASDARLNQLHAIEHGLADLLGYLENQRTSAAQRGSHDAAEASALKRDVQRTQDSLETVHGALGQVVDRLATIESSIRNVQLPRAANIPEISAPEPPTVTPRPVPAAAAPPVPFIAPAAAPQPRPEPAPVAAPEPAPVAPPTAKPMPAASGPTANPAPATDRRPIDPDLPPDHPLEPGAVRGRGTGSPAERIAASEAALENVRPPVIPDPGGKSNFIAAARRAAQAAIVEAPPPKEKAAGTGAITSITSRMSGKIRKLMVGAGVILFVLGSLHFVATRIWSSGSSSPPTEQVPKDENRQAAPAANTEEPAAPQIPPGRQSAILPPAFAFPPGPVASATGLPGGALAPDPTRETTGSIRQPQVAAPAPIPSPPLPPPAPARGNGSDRLPAGIGAGLRAAVLKGDPAAEFEIATRYAAGHGVPQNLAEAATWFERAAAKGLAPAQFRLGGLYEKGMGVRKNTDTARRHYLAAAEAGNAKAMHNLAVLYAEGVDGKPDYQTAARWFRKAADHGVLDSQYNLAVLYARGIGVETNLAEAFKWFALASREGDRDAARKRDDVAGRLDKPSLAAAMTAAQTWQARPQPEAAIHVAVPPGGWDGAPVPSTPKRRVGPKIETPSRR